MFMLLLTLPLWEGESVAVRDPSTLLSVAVPLAALVPVVLAVTICGATRSAHRDLERTAVRGTSALTVALFLGLLTCALLIFLVLGVRGAEAQAAQAARSCLYLSGIAVLAARLFGVAASVLLPLLVQLLSIYLEAGSRSSQPPYLLPAFRSAGDAPAWVLTGAVSVVALLSLARPSTRRDDG